MLLNKWGRESSMLCNNKEKTILFANTPSENKTRKNSTIMPSLTQTNRQRNNNTTINQAKKSHNKLSNIRNNVGEDLRVRRKKLKGKRV